MMEPGGATMLPGGRGRGGRGFLGCSPGLAWGAFPAGGGAAGACGACPAAGGGTAGAGVSSRGGFVVDPGDVA